MMDRNLDIDNFELLLRERSDEFKMYPAKRIWHSIYNNIHPGKKWPSIAMSITLIAILLLVGYLNTNNKNLNQEQGFNVAGFSTTTSDISNSLAFNKPFLIFTDADKRQQNSVTNNENNFTLNISSYKNRNTSNAEGVSNVSFNKNFTSSGNRLPDASLNTIRVKTSIENSFSVVIAGSYQTEYLEVTNTINNTPLISLKSNPVDNNEKTKNTISENETVLNEKKSAQAGDDILKNKSFIALSENNGINTNTLATEVKENKNILSGNEDLSSEQTANSLTREEKDWIENYALYNRPAPKKWAGKLSSQMYITPSVVYRNLRNTISTQPDINKEIIQHPSFGLEIGGGILYDLFKGVKLKTGVQVNFTRYNTSAYGNSHPVATTIMLRSSTGDPFPAYRSTPYSNSDGITPLKLHNETFQISLPVGIDVKIAGNKKIQWNIGATIQPSYVFAGKSYLISSDNRNYIKESSLLNRLNLNAGFETFITYKTDKGLTFQLGPQFRRQLFTTNHRQYTIEEKLNNYGFKFGITKLIK
jgi:hypothetical protein